MWKDRENRGKERNKMKTVRIFWAGDSTVKYNRIDTYPQTGIGQVLGLYLKPEVQVFDMAENGRSTKSFMDEGRLAAIERELKPGDFFFIQFGHNDEKKEDPLRYAEAFGSFQENLRTYIQAARNRGAWPVLISPIERRRFDEQGNFQTGTHGPYPEAMEQVAQEEQVPFINMTEKSGRFLAREGKGKTVCFFMHIKPGEFPGTRYEQGLADDTHLRYEGAVKMAGLVAEGFWELGGRYRELVWEEGINLY